MGEILVDEPLLHKVPYNPATEALGECSGVLDGQMVEDAGSINPSLKGNGMPVRVEAEHVPEGLIRDYGTCAHIRPGRLPAVFLK